MTTIEHFALTVGFTTLGAGSLTGVLIRRALNKQDKYWVYYMLLSVAWLALGIGFWIKG